MRHGRLLVVAGVVVVLAALGVVAREESGDTMLQMLEARANAPLDSLSGEREVHRDVGPGSRLFYMTGPDHARCVRSIRDVNSDGLDEVVVGIDESGTDNVFCLDGASSGAATVVWSIQTMDGVSGGAPYGDQSLVPISDPYGFGSQNLLVGTAWGGRTAYHLDGLTGATIWKFDTYLTVDSGWVYSLCELDDINGDTVPECAFGAGSFNDSVYMIDGASSATGQATVIWQYYAGDAIYSVRDIGDVNGDGDHDVLAAVGDNVDKLVCLDGGTTLPGGDTVWEYTPGESVYACEVLPDITGDGVDEALAVLWTLDGSAIRAVNGATGIEEWASTEVNDYGMMVDIIKDVTGDAVGDIVVASWANSVIVLHGKTGSVVWQTPVGTLNGGDVWTVSAIDDLNGDGYQDVIAGSFDYHVYAMHGLTGEVFWAYNTSNRIYSVYPVGDLNGDGRAEVAVGTQLTNNSVVVHVLDGGSGIPLFADDFESGDTSEWTMTVGGVG